MFINALTAYDHGQRRSQGQRFEPPHADGQHDEQRQLDERVEEQRGMQDVAA